MQRPAPTVTRPGAARLLSSRALVLPGALLAIGALTALTPQDPKGDPAVERGRALFDRPFHIAAGLGNPDFNADSCRACHSDPGMGGAGPLELNVSRFGNDNGGAGPFVNLPGGQAISRMRVPEHNNRENLPVDADVFEQRQTPTLFGSGLIDTIPGVVITANEDPTDANQDGIFGVARRVEVNGVPEIGRFGWKAQIPKLLDFMHDAMINEMGITTPDDGRGFSTSTDGDAIPDPELPTTDIDDLFAFVQSLPAPQRGGSTDPQVQVGLQTFFSVGCAKCHTPTLLGTNGPVPLYSNLLLHNVMPAGYRGMAEPGAPAGMFRTPPLWGIKDTAPYMHDGRAETLRDAIMAHAGEAEQVRLEFEALTAAAQDALILFLEDL